MRRSLPCRCSVTRPPIEQDAEALRDGRPAHLEMSRKRVDGAGGLDEVVEHPAPCRMADCCEGVGLALGNHHHAANIRKRLLTCHAQNTVRTNRTEEGGRRRSAVRNQNAQAQFEPGEFITYSQDSWGATVEVKPC
jgi:hypothetical protein